MRKIKFKIWADNKFYDKCLVGNTNNTNDDKWTCPMVWLEDSKEWVHCDNGVICQYTGLKDKNGKEIYEGDIVTEYDYPFIDEEGKQNYIGIVEFYEDVVQYGFTLKCVNENKRGISNGINEGFEANSDLICEDLEVIRQHI